MSFTTGRVLRIDTEMLRPWPTEIDDALTVSVSLSPPTAVVEEVVGEPSEEVEFSVRLVDPPGLGESVVEPPCGVLITA
jgi:hypothetical protein